ncbi:MAG: CRTAC1 family protein, partial [Nitrospirae bacterium]|nr:CRTAC1 family protein [Nitrospirota bacterium]
FSDNTITSGVAEVTHGFLGWSIKFFDYDNDGDQDIFVANGHVMDNVNDLEKSVTYPQKNLLFQNIGEGVFRHIALSGGGLGLEKVSRGAAIGDYDNDGDLDILVTNWNQTADLLQNQIGNRNNWVQIQVVGRTSNRSGIGARIRIIVDGQAQYQEVHAGGGYLSFSDLRVHFGVGQAQQIEQLEIRWPSGQVDEASDL